MYSWVQNQTDIESCSGRKQVFELPNDRGIKGHVYSCAFETMKDPGCGKSFFFGDRGGITMCYCETLGMSCTRTTSNRFTEYRLADGR